MHRNLRARGTLAASILALTLVIAVSAGAVARQDGGGASRSRHLGPAVHVSEAGPMRFAAALLGGFRVERALDVARFTDNFYRAPGNEGYERVLEHIAGKLRAVGFGGDDARLELGFLESELDAPAWTPRRARVTLLVAGREPRVLHSFESSGDRDRVVLPVNAPSCDVEGRVALNLNDLKRGDILVTEAPVRQVAQRAAHFGAAAVLSGSLAGFNTDPSGRERHLDAIQYSEVGSDVELPVGQISPRSLAAITAAVGAQAEVRIAFRSEVELETRPLRTLVAAIVGATLPDEAIAIASHVQEPGACDNASGVAGLVEGALAIVAGLRSEELAWPARTLVFLWGDEIVQSRVWLDTTERRCVAGFSADMTGESPEHTGAIALLERMPDPGALLPLAPDAHTPWGAGAVDADTLAPNGLAVIARCALADVAALDPPWRTADHPWEGGSDHDQFIQRGIPGVLFWHFTDFAYHTSLDRMDMLDGRELRRTTTAILAAALAVADARPGDRERYERSLALEEELRVRVARAAGDAQIAELWQAWCLGARAWLHALCGEQ